jgi:hypothetical protein
MVATKGKRALNPKIKKRNEIVNAERKKIMNSISDAKRRDVVMRENFRNGGIIPIKGSKAHKAIQDQYHSWLKANGHDLPKPKKPKPPGYKKKKRTKKNKKAE